MSGDDAETQRVLDTLPLTDEEKQRLPSLDEDYDLTTLAGRVAQEKKAADLLADIYGFLQKERPRPHFASSNNPDVQQSVIDSDIENLRSSQGSVDGLYAAVRVAIRLRQARLDWKMRAETWVEFGTRISGYRKSKLYMLEMFTEYLIRALTKVLADVQMPGNAVVFACPGWRQAMKPFVPKKERVREGDTEEAMDEGEALNEDDGQIELPLPEPPDDDPLHQELRHWKQRCDALEGEVVQLRQALEDLRMERSVSDILDRAPQPALAPPKPPPAPLAPGERPAKLSVAGRRALQAMQNQPDDPDGKLQYRQVDYFREQGWIAVDGGGKWGGNRITEKGRARLAEDC